MAVLEILFCFNPDTAILWALPPRPLSVFMRRLIAFFEFCHTPELGKYELLLLYLIPEQASCHK